MTFFHKEVAGWVNPRRIYLDIEFEVVDNADPTKAGLKTIKRYAAPVNPPAHGLIEDMALNIGSSLLTKQDGLYGMQARFLHLTQHSTAAKKTFLNEFEGKKQKKTFLHEKTTFSHTPSPLPKGCDSDYEQDNSNNDIRTAGYTAVTNGERGTVYEPKNGIGRLAESISNKKSVKYRFQVFGPLNTIDTLVSFF